MILKNKLVGFIIFTIICLTLFVLWLGYRLYQTKYSQTRPGVYTCSPDGRCLLYPKTAAVELCPITFNSETCDNECDNPNNHCSQ